MTTVTYQPIVITGPDSFAAHLNRLFSSIYPPGRGPFTSQELIAALTMRGVLLSAPYLSQLRTGNRTRPSRETMGHLADFFGVKPDYFTDPDYRAVVDEDLHWLDLAHDPTVRRLTTALNELDAETREQLLTAAGA
mgnify:CR=1 FL=1